MIQRSEAKSRVAESVGASCSSKKPSWRRFEELMEDGCRRAGLLIILLDWIAGGLCALTCMQES